MGTVLLETKNFLPDILFRRSCPDEEGGDVLGQLTLGGRGSVLILNSLKIDQNVSETQNIFLKLHFFILVLIFLNLKMYPLFDLVFLFE